MGAIGSIPRMLGVFVALIVLQLVSFGLLIDMRFSSGGLLFTGLLVIGLLRGSRLAWSLLVLIEAIPLLALAGALLSTSGETLWGNVAVMLASGIPLEAVLLSRPMRTHVGLTGGPAPGAPVPR